MGTDATIVNPFYSYQGQAPRQVRPDSMFQAPAITLGGQRKLLTTTPTPGQAAQYGRSTGGETRFFDYAPPAPAQYRNPQAPTPVSPAEGSGTPGWQMPQGRVADTVSSPADQAAGNSMAAGKGMSGQPTQSMMAAPRPQAPVMPTTHGGSGGGDLEGFAGAIGSIGQAIGGARAGADGRMDAAVAGADPGKDDDSMQGRVRNYLTKAFGGRSNQDVAMAQRGGQAIQRMGPAGGPVDGSMFQVPQFDVAPEPPAPTAEDLRAARHQQYASMFS